MIDDNIPYYTAVPDDDNNRVSDAADVCLGTVIPEPVPTGQLGVNRFALTDADAIFDTTPPKGKGPRKVFTRPDTAGCSCGQIIEALGLGEGDTKFGCSSSALRQWIEMVHSRGRRTAFCAVLLATGGLSQRTPNDLERGSVLHPVVYRFAHEQVLPARCARLFRKVLLGERFYSMVSRHLQGDGVLALTQPVWLSDIHLRAQALPELLRCTAGRTNRR